MVLSLTLLLYYGHSAFDEMSASCLYCHNDVAPTLACWLIGWTLAICGQTARRIDAARAVGLEKCQSHIVFNGVRGFFETVFFAPALRYSQA